MRLIILVISVTIVTFPSIGQTHFPWESPLRMAWSTDGTNFTQQAVFQDSSGVPSVIRWKGDTLICAFQWFRQPKDTPTWDRVAVKFSYNKGASWTNPKPITLNGLPSNYQRPFDPTLTVYGKDSLRIYFSSGQNTGSTGLDASINTYSARSADGINFTFEPNPRFDHPTTRAIDPAVTYYGGGKWHYICPIGSPQEGAYHAISSDGLTFTQQANIISDNSHNWTGNLVVDSANELRFYGSGMKLWFNTSKDGLIWDGYINTNLNGGDPSVVKLSSNSYLIIYVGEPYITALEEDKKASISIYPNPASNYLTIKTPVNLSDQYKIYSQSGKEIDKGNIKNAEISIGNLPSGTYFLYLNYLKGQPQIIKFVKE